MERKPQDIIQLILALANIGGDNQDIQDQQQDIDRGPNRLDKRSQHCVFTQLGNTVENDCPSKQRYVSAPRSSGVQSSHRLRGNQNSICLFFCSSEKRVCRGFQSRVSKRRERIQGERLRHWISHRELQNFYNV